MDRQSVTREREHRPDQILSRRKIFTGAAGVAVAGAAAAAVLSEASPASAATTTESAALAPAVVDLTDAATIAVDASQGNDFRVTIAGDRMMGNPANPADGQKITVQVTQGAGGPFTLAWGSAYGFSSGLPQPSLSTAAGDTDLLCFIYNGAKSSWLFVAFVAGFAPSGTSTPTPTPTAATSPASTPSTSPTGTGGGAGTYRLFGTTAGPSTPVSYSGPFAPGIIFGVTTGGCWLEGYWWWVCPSSQSTAAQMFALWCLYGSGAGTLVPNSAATSGTLTAGSWNYVPLPQPVPLAIGATYVAVTGFSGSFPDTSDQFGSNDPYSDGIRSGPLVAYSDASGSNPSPFGNSQAVFSVAGTDPTTVLPAYGSSSSNFWVDIQITDSAPSGTSYRLWPSYPTIPGHVDSDTAGYTVSTEFTLSEVCALDNIWFYSASGSGALPTQCGIWSVSSQSVVSGTGNTSPAWTGAAGSGWVACSYSGVTLPAGDYKAAVFYGGGSEWYTATTGYWTTGGPGASSITSGPLTAPGNSAATSPGQSCYNRGSWAYPQTSAGNGENNWVDIEVTPS